MPRWAAMRLRSSAFTVAALDPTSGRAVDEGVDITVGENMEGGAQSRDDAMLELIVETGRVHQRERHAGDRILGEQCVNIFRHQARTAQAHRLDRKTFRLEPFGQQRDLRGAAGTVHAFDYDQRTAEFFIVYAGKGKP